MVQAQPTTVRPPTPPPVRSVSILPAAAVLGVALLTLLVFGLANTIGGSTTTSTTLPIVVGGLPMGSTPLFGTWTQTGAIPGNVTSALIAPAGARLIGAVTTGGGGAGQFDAEDRLVVDASRERLLGFYRSNLVARGWKVISESGTPHGGAELLFQKAGTDGFYWEAGVNALAPSRAVTPYTFRMFQVSDFS